MPISGASRYGLSIFIIMENFYNISYDGDNRTLSIAGHLDTMAAHKLAKGIEPLVEDTGKCLTVKLDDLEYISSSGLRCLMLLYNATRCNGASFAITGVPNPIRDVFNLTGLTKVFGL